MRGDEEVKKVKGFNKLTPEQQKGFIWINEKHKAAVGADYKDEWTPISVKPLGRNLKVMFKNGEWLHYTPEGTWY